MSMETALRSRLKDDTAVAAIVGIWVDWTLRPQKATYPSVVLQIVSDVRPQTYQGNIGFRETRVQIDCYGMTRDTVIELREAVIAAIGVPGEYHGVTFGRSFINNIIDRGESTDTGFVHRDLIDASIWHNA